MNGETKTNEKQNSDVNSDVIIIKKKLDDLTDEEAALKNDRLVLYVEIKQISNGEVSIFMSAYNFDGFTEKIFVKYYDDKDDEYKYRIRKWDDKNEKYESVMEHEELTDIAKFYFKRSEAMQKLKEIINEIKEQRMKARASKLETQYLTVII